jgi:hypothetical protein
MLKNDRLDNYLKHYNIEWAVELPEGCPPQEILVPENERMYRLTLNTDKVTEDDFKSYMEMFPEKKYTGNLKVMAAGLSLISTNKPQSIILPMMKKFYGIAELILNPEDGVLLQTGKNPEHYTWWRTKKFDINSAKIISNEKNTKNN